MFYDLSTGLCYRAGVSMKWEGMEPAFEPEPELVEDDASVELPDNPRIGLLLDYDDGSHGASLTVYKNERLLGQLVDGKWMARALPFLFFSIVILLADIRACFGAHPDAEGQAILTRTCYPGIFLRNLLD